MASQVLTATSISTVFWVATMCILIEIHWRFIWTEVNKITGVNVLPKWRNKKKLIFSSADSCHNDMQKPHRILSFHWSIILNWPWWSSPPQLPTPPKHTPLGLMTSQFLPLSRRHDRDGRVCTCLCKKIYMLPHKDIRSWSEMSRSGFASCRPRVQLLYWRLFWCLLIFLSSPKLMTGFLPHFFIIICSHPPTKYL
jgi:hypothetical protein